MSEEHSNGELLRLGALWKAKPGGKAVATGTINNDIRIVILRNDRKEKDSHPDLILFIAKKENKDGGSSTEPKGDQADDDFGF